MRPGAIDYIILTSLIKYTRVIMMIYLLPYMTHMGMSFNISIPTVTKLGVSFNISIAIYDLYGSF
jgi:hypothetical protein